MATGNGSGRRRVQDGLHHDPAATSGDQVQYEANEGPCLDAVTTAVVHAQSFPDVRWPTLTARPH